MEARLGVRLLNRTTRSVSLTEAGEAYLAKIGPALSDVLDAAEELNALQGRPSGVLRINAACISIAMVLQALLAGFLKTYPDVQTELSNDEGYVDIVERGFHAGIRLGEGVQKDMVAIPLGGPVSVAVVGSPAYFKMCRSIHRNWWTTTAFDFGFLAVFTSGSSRRMSTSSNMKSAAISPSATLCFLWMPPWMVWDWPTHSSNSHSRTSVPGS